MRQLSVVKNSRAWAWTAAVCMLLWMAVAVAKPKLPDPPSPEDPPEEPTPGDTGGGGEGETNAATPLYPFPSVGGSRQAGGADAPIALGALHPTLTESDAALATPFGPVTLTRSYGKGLLGRGFTSPFGGQDWTHSLHSLVIVSDERIVDGHGICDSALCRRWKILTPEGELYDFRPCTLEGKPVCYAGEAYKNDPLEDIEVERAESTQERNVQLRWDGTRFELLRPGQARLVYVKVLDHPDDYRSSSRGVYALRYIYGARTPSGEEPAVATLTYSAEGEAPCPQGEMPFYLPALKRVSLAGGAKLDLEWIDARKVTCPYPEGHDDETEDCEQQPFQCVLGSVWLTGPDGVRSLLVRYGYGQEGLGPVPGKLVKASYPSSDGSLVTDYIRTERTRPGGQNTWEETWRVVDDGRERFTQTVTNVHSPHQPANVYEFITNSRSSSGQYEVRAFHAGDHLSCVAGWDYLGNYGCAGDADYFGPYYTAPGTYAAGQVQEVVSNHVLLGDELGSSMKGKVFERYQLVGGGKSSHNDGRPATVTQKETRCRMGEDEAVPCPGVQDVEEEWRVKFAPNRALKPNLSDTLNLADRNPRGIWTEYLYTQLQGGPRSPLSEHLILEGRSGLTATTYSADGTPGVPSTVPPHREWYDWEWVGNNEDVRAELGFETRLARIRRDSVMAPSSATRARDVPDSAQRIVHFKAAPETSQVMAVIQEGWSKRFSPDGAWPDEKERRFLATFSYTSYVATGGEPSEYARGRVVETHGPCWSTSKDAEYCDVALDGLGQPVQVPVTRLEYGESHGYLSAQSTYATCGVVGGAVACDASSELRTEFLAYDARGNLLVSRDPNGVETRMAYTHGRLMSETTVAPGLAPLEKSYVYDGRELMATRMPSGDFHVTCYRERTTDGCVGGRRTKVPQWRAKAKDALGRDWREKIQYVYEPGTDRISEERYLERAANGALVRRVVATGADAYGRTTRVQAGDKATSYVARTGFDVGGNMVARGEAYHEAPPFCLDPSKKRDPACAGFSYDSLDRLTSLTFGSGEDAAACFEYDRGGNVSRALVGCEGDCRSCKDGVELRYEFDDFGRLLSVWEPYKSGPTRFQHDAMGNVVVKSMPGSPWLTETRYDALGRVRRTLAVAPSGEREVLHAFDYDGVISASEVAEGCPIPEDSLGRKGHIQRRQDSAGYHWYVYDAFGRTTAIYRQRYGQACQEGHSEAAPNSFYAYDSAGRLSLESYPHGLQVHYIYGEGLGGLASRVAAIDVSAAGVARRPLIRKVQYEPYGGLRAYEAATAGTPTAVEWLTGSSHPSGTNCGGRPDPGGDNTGDIRALWVSRAPLDGRGTGDVYQQVYSWQGGVRVREDTCLLGQPAHTVCYGASCSKSGTVRGGYDEKLQLVSAQRLADGAQEGPFQSRRFSYDRRGNRTEEIRDGQKICYVYDGDLLVSVYPAGPSNTCSDAMAGSFGQLEFTHDGSGRTTSRSGKGLQVTFDYDGVAGEAVPTALASVYRTVNVDGAQIESFYDASGRRWRKEYADGSYREFYWADTELREERIPGSDGVLGGVLDSYVWLDGRPVALVRGWQDLPLATEGIACDRDGERVPCGAYFPVVDPIGKPVLLLDGAGRVSGSGSYDAFGVVNRVYRGSANADDLQEMSFHHPSVSGEGINVVVRVRMSGKGDVHLYDSEGRVIKESLGSREDAQSGRDWVELPMDGRVSASTMENGVYLEGYEYRQYESGSSPTWLPLRLPGQYHDEETDLFENWNRFYDAETGRYLQPEPKLLDGSWLSRLSSQGFAPSVYAYSNSNPMVFKDPTGLYFVADLFSGAVLQRLMSVPELAPYIERMMFDPEVEFKLVAASGLYDSRFEPVLDQYGGAVTLVGWSENGPPVDSNNGSIMGVVAFGYFEENFVGEHTVESILAHELGHMYGVAYDSNLHNGYSKLLEHYARQVLGLGPSSIFHE